MKLSRRVFNWLWWPLRFSHEESWVRESLIRSQQAFRLSHDVVELESLPFSRDDLFNLAMTKLSPKVFHSVVWPLRFDHDEAQSESLNSTMMTCPIQPWQSQVRKSSIRSQPYLLFGHDEVEFENLWFDHGDVFDSAMMKPSQRAFQSDCGNLSNSAMINLSRRIFDSAMAT